MSKSNLSFTYSPNGYTIFHHGLALRKVSVCVRRGPVQDQIDKAFYRELAKSEINSIMEKSNARTT